MSGVTASTDPTPASPGEQWSRTMDLVDEIKKKLDQANGICCAVRWPGKHMEITRQYMVRCGPQLILSRMWTKRSMNCSKQSSKERINK